MNDRVGRSSLRALAGLSTAALLLTALGSPGIAAEPSGPSDCPDILPVEEATDGLLATGWTTVDSETPRSFGVEVLGVLKDGVAPGRDMIVVEVSGPVVTQNGDGIWFGMSGSPVYHDGDLLGAVAFGLSGGPSRIGGLTPAEDMANVPEGSSETARTRVPLTDAQRADIAAETGTSSDEVGNSFVRLKTPLNIGGATDRVRRKVVKAIKREEVPLVPYAGGTSSSGELEITDDAPSAGQSFAAALSYGDVTFAGVGTTTMVCDGRVLAFGHPFLWTGEAQWGAARAEAITIVKDSVWGSYKLANIDATFGTVDQDRLAAIGANVDDIPSVIPIESTMTDVNLARTRDGHTLAVPMLDFVPFITFIHLLSNADVTIDRIGKGSSSTTWTLSGTRESGDPWSVSRTNRFASPYDISYSSLFEVENALYQILFNEFEDVQLSDVDFDAEFEKEVKRYEIERALVAYKGSGFQNWRKITVRPGDRFRVRALMLDQAGNQKQVTRKFIVPERFRRGFLSVSGGGDDFGFFECFSEYDKCYDGSKGSSFDKLLDKIASAPKNNDLVMTFRTGRGQQREVAPQDQVVSGFDSIRVVRKGSGKGKGDTGTVSPEKGKY